MSTVIVGDLHIKAKKILPRIDDLLSKRPDITRVVFTGDYCDDWHVDDDMFQDDIEYLALWFKEKRKTGLQIDLTMGNHDFQYFLGAPGPGTRVHLYSFVRNTLFPLGVTIATVVDGYLVTHGGLTASWESLCMDTDDGKPLTAQQACDQLNAMYENGDARTFHMFDMCGFARGGFEVPSPLWADMRELESDPAPGIDQIVGHTPTWSATRSKSYKAGEEGVELWFCDTFSSYSTGEGIGDGSVLVVDDGEFEKVLI